MQKLQCLLIVLKRSCISYYMTVPSISLGISSCCFICLRVNRPDFFIDFLILVLHVGGLPSLQPPVPLLAAPRAQKVNDEPVKVLHLLFFVYFIWKWVETFEKLHFFTFGSNQSFYLTHSAREYLEKLAFKKKTTKNPTLNGFISKARAYSKSKLTFSESSFNFLQNRVVFTRQGALSPTTPGAAASGSPCSKS